MRQLSTPAFSALFSRHPRRGLRHALALVLGAGLALTAAAAARAEGALSVGRCGAFGYAYNYDSENQARERALRECQTHGGKNCKVVVAFRGNCAAFAVDTGQSCGAWGWATRGSQPEADSAARSQCRKAGGTSCRVRAQVCDAKGRVAPPKASSSPAPAMTTNWTSTTLTQQQCLDRADRVMTEAGMTKNFEVLKESVFGEQGDYTGQVRCVTQKNIVMFVVVGPSLENARSFMSKLFDKF